MGMSILTRFVVTGVASFIGGAITYRKIKIGGSYLKFWKKEFWMGKPITPPAQ